jgi:parallel beta-helix repeat protein
VTFHDSGTHVIKLSPDTDHLTFTNCEIYNSGDRDPTQGQGVDAVNVDDLDFEHNYIHDTTQNAIFVKGGSQRAFIANNVIKNGGYGGILLGQDTDADVFDTIQNPNRYEALDCIAENNVVDGTKYGGIQAWSSHNCQFINNWVSNAGQSGQGAIFISINSFNKQNDNLSFTGNVIGSAPGKQLINIADGAMGANLFMANNQYYGNNSTIDNNPNFSGTIAQWQAHSHTDAGSSFVATGNPPFTGDLNHDGRVDIDDFLTLDFQFPMGNTGAWWMADVNLDGKINADDYVVMDVGAADQAAALQAAQQVSGGAAAAAPAAVQTQALPQDVTLATTTSAAVPASVQANAAVSPTIADAKHRLIDEVDAPSSGDLTLATL